ncbi:MAG: ATP-binding cassette domain-containing protein, partial [Bacteroidetes bacterium]
MLQTRNLHYRYPSGAALRFPDITCGRDEHWLLLGPSGSGKTTLLHLLAGLLTPTGGEVRIGDTVLGSLKGAHLDSFRGRHVGVIFQQSHFVAALSVLENLLLAQKLAQRPLDRARARQLLQRLGIGGKEGAKPFELSQGEQQRVAIARALINAPELILADE